MIMLERFSADARQTVAAAREQASLLRHNFIGCEHLLLALATLENDPAAGTLAAFGLDHARLRDGVVAVVGEGIRTAETPVAPEASGTGDPLDATALFSLGIDLDEVRRSIEASFGPGALDRSRSTRDRTTRNRATRRRMSRSGSRNRNRDCIRPSFTPRAKKTLEIAVRTAALTGDRTISTGHLLLGLLNQRDNAALRVLKIADVQPDALRRELARRMDTAA